MRPYLEKTLHKKRAGGVVQGVDPEFKHKKKEKRKPTCLTSRLGSPVYLTTDIAHVQPFLSQCGPFLVWGTRT
jgi:hypothetical protein